MQLVLATRNPHKLEEIRSIIRMNGVELLSALDFPDLPDVVEDGDTFEANAVKKAKSITDAAGLWAMADDSGLEVEALDGAPGVYSARYAGEPVDYDANNRKLLCELDGQPNRNARFRTVLALTGPDGSVRIVEGICPGRIGFEEKGDHGFGYDPLFIPDGETRTFAEMDSEKKNRISHRAHALAAASAAWFGDTNVLTMAAG